MANIRAGIEHIIPGKNTIKRTHKMVMRIEIVSHLTAFSRGVLTGAAIRNSIFIILVSIVCIETQALILATNDHLYTVFDHIIKT